MSLSPPRGCAQSYDQFKKSIDQYVYFSTLTMGGSSGRAVKIHKDLFLPFFCVVDPATYDGQHIIRQIENLRTTCIINRKETGSKFANDPRQSDQHKARLASISKNFDQVLIVKNLHVYYRMGEEKEDKAKTIYITNIRQISESNSSTEFGLYESKVKYGSSKTSLEKMKSLSIDGKTVYLNGEALNKNRAMESAQHVTGTNTPTLFYCPSQATNELGVLGSKTLSKTTVSTINELATVLKSNQRATREINWYVEGEGLNILAHALKQTPGELANHNFRLINPIGNSAKVIEHLSHKKAKFEGEFFKYDGNKAALVSLGIQKDELMKVIGKLPAGKNYDTTARANILESINSLSSTGTDAVKAKQTLTKNKITFIQLLKAAGGFRK